VVLFVPLACVQHGGDAPSLAHGARLFAEEAGGGVLFGVALGYVAFRMLKSIDHYRIEVLITLATVLGGYALAARLHASGPLAMVVAGLIVGNQGRALAMSDTTRRHLDMFWELLDEILNSVLFVLMGLEVILLHFSAGVALAAAAAIVVTLGARFLSVGAPVALLGRAFGLPPGSWQVLTWGGLRGGIAIALALSLPASAERDVVLALTYAVVAFSILCQGLTIGAVVRRALRAGSA
jgi:Na+:H+ antiporter